VGLVAACRVVLSRLVT